MSSKPSFSAFDATPNAGRLAPYLARRRDPAELSEATLRDERAALWANWRPFFENWTSAASGATVFDRFGFSTDLDFEFGDPRFFGDAEDETFESLFFERSDGLQFLVVAPIATFRLAFAAFLGVDVARICADGALWSAFNGDLRRRGATTALERETLERAAARFAGENSDAIFDFSAQNDGESALRTRFRVAFREFPTAALGALGDEFFYWERRESVLSGRRFPWTLVFPLGDLEMRLGDALSGRNAAPESVETLGKWGDWEKSRRAGERINADFGEILARTETTLAPETSIFSELSPTNAPKTRRSTIELSVEVARGTIPTDVWRALKPGDVLPTDAAADELFLTLLDGEPRFLSLPGLFGGVPAAQIKRTFAANAPIDGDAF